MPAQGRQLITFTDSRQGTARLAARIQHEAERNLIRSVIYHLVQARDPATDQAALQLREEIAKLEPLASGDGPAVKALADIIAVKRGELRSLESADGGVPWDRVVERLSNEPDLEGPLLDVWNGRDSSFSLADRDGSATRLARMLLFREFLRRPRRENSAETMGLGTLRYLAIDGLKAPSVPSLFIEHGASIDDWKDFLYVLVTHFIRANSAVDVDRNIRRWIGRNVPIRFIKSPREEAAEASSLRWPSPFRSKRSRPIRLLKQAFGLDLDDPLNKDLVDDCMEQAWGVIRLLDSRAHTDFTLDLTKASVAGVGDAWFCPVTRTVLDRCFRGITPYLPHVVGPSSINCEPIVLPHLPFPWLVRSDDSKIEPAEVRDWLQTDEKVQTARRMGVWSDLHDRIVQRGMFLRSAEHSAQQPSGRLQRYERAFREGQINVLNCSTTMEMGVDIGGLSVVVMANVPPAPANYLQRVGRAGRRGENLSLGFTVCKDDPLGWSVFRSPAWPFMHAIRPPAVRLDSPVIVQRHVNATLLAHFLRTVAPGAKNLRTLEAGWFFERVDATRLSQAEEFIIWCETPGAVMNETRRVALALVQGTCLEESEMLLQDAAAAMREIRSSWIAERDALLADMERTESRDVAQTALQFQIKRLRKSFLLSELSGRSFLPGYGFPTDVVSFVLSDEAMRALAADGVGREDNRFLSRSYPSRQLDIAMREYAPGAEIVLDGLVHRSRGITLNWKRPAGEADTREIQAIAHAWRCRACGAGGTSRTWPVHCSSCGDEGLKVMDYLQPAGFTVDAFERPHADYTRPSYIQPAEPFIAANGGEWIALPDPDLGVCRVTRTGEVFRHTEGPNGYGYALCLHCGRAEAETAPSAGILPPLPDGMRAHVPLRGTQRNGHRDSGVCSGGETPFGIRRHLALGYSIHTDVFELRLVGLSDRTVATSLVVALREALARRLGIDADEMGWAIQPIADGAGSGQYALFLHDNASGGAGFASQGGTLIADILKGAVDVLICPRGCSRSCHSCLLSRDTRFDDEFLDRHKALAFLQDNVLSRLSLRDDRCLFGSASLAENRPLAEALDRRLSEMADARLRVWLSGNPAEWDLENWDGAGLVGKWGMRGRSVDVVFSAAVASNLSFSEAFALDRFAQRTRANLLTVGELPSSPPIIADIRSATQNVAWSGETDALRVPGANWGTSSREPIVRGPCPIDAYTFDTQPFDPGSKVLSGQAGAIPLSITAELNGPAREFGKRFWEIVKASAPDIAAVLDVDGAPVDIAYSDRYLVNPLTLRLLFEVLRPFVAGKRDNGSVSTVTVRTLAERAGGRPSLAAKITDDWNDLRQRDSVAEIAGRLVGVDLHLVPMALRDLPHHRSIEISCGGTNARVFLDQGFGYWTTASRTRFDFNARAVDQARSMLAAAFEVVQRGSHPTMLFVMRD
ncbi:MAG: helicase-related protein [FCB group bacterium]|jgi:hypothetical protein|nr:helicase-related protein [FCB group bacterium]